MENSFNTFFNRLKGWPWQIWRQFNPAFKVITVLLTIAFLPFNPFNWILLAIFGYFAVTATGEILAAIAVVFIGLLIWLVIEALYVLISWSLVTYILPAIVGSIAILFERDPETILF